MSAPFGSQNLDHLGLVAAMYDELGMGEVLDRTIPQNRHFRRVSVGQAVSHNFDLNVVAGRCNYKSSFRVPPIGTT